MFARRLFVIIAVLFAVAAFADEVDEIFVDTPEAGLRLEVSKASYVRGNHIMFGLIIENINNRLKELDDSYISQVPTEHRGRANRLLKEIRALASLLPAEQTVKVKVEPVKHKDERLKDVPRVKPLNRTRLETLKYLENSDKERVEELD